MSNFPDYCDINDRLAPWNSGTVRYQYRILISVDHIQFVSEVFTDSVEMEPFTIKSADDWYYLENDLYKIIEDSLSSEIKDYNYNIDLINWTYDR